MREKRPRIKPNSAMATLAIIDEQAFIQNKSSQNAKKVDEVIENFNLNIWFDKHYCDREQHGDENGKRSGINKNLIQSILKISIKHLIYFSLKLKNFQFINYDEKIHQTRIAIQERNEDGNMVNLIVEFHHINSNKYEVTVMTAMMV